MRHLELRLREKMGEKYCQKENQLKELNQLEPSIPLAYRNEFSLKDKENIFKDMYFFINLSDRIICEARKELESEKE